MPETQPLANDPASRTQEGTILDQSHTNTETTTNANPNTPAEPKPAPAEYTPFTAPEGSSLDPKAIEGATALFREFGLDQSQAQKLIDWGASREKETAGKSAEVYNQMRTDWRSQVEAHPTLGGAKLDETRAEIGKAIATLPPKLQTAFKDAMNLTGAGDHPAVVEAFYTLAKSVNEGQHVAGAGPSEAGQVKPGTSVRPSPAQSMFPNLPTMAH